MDLNKKWKIMAIVSTCLLVLVSFLYAQSLSAGKAPETEPEQENTAVDDAPAEENWLSLWNEDAPAKTALEEYVRDGDALLFKASHSFGFEKVAKCFIEKGNA